jgi:outer membrane lipoprotein-sorting protein
MRLLNGFIALLTIAGGAVAADKPATDKPAPSPPAQAAPANGNTNAAAAPGAAGAISNDSSIDQILDALDARGRNLQAFTADVSLTEGDPALANEVTRRGKVLYQDQQGKARLRVTFETRETGTRTFNEKVEYLLQDGWLTDRTYDPKRIEVRRQVLRPGEKINLLKLGEGPFPLPIGQKKEKVHEQFEVKKPAPAKDDPAGTIHVQLTPKPGTNLARKFDVIDVWVDAKTNMPARIDTAQGETVRTTELKHFTVNPTPPLADADFALPKIDESQWSLHEEPFND